MSSLTTYNVTSIIGSLPTVLPVQYSVTFDRAPASSQIRHDFGSIIASHDESYSLWDEKDIAPTPLKSYVLDGNVNQMTEELTNAFSSNVINDFIVADNFFLNDTVIPEENLIVREKGPYVSFVTRVDMGNHVPPLFAGVSKICVCGPSQESAKGNISDSCEFWFESVTVPLFLYKIVNSTSADDGADKHSAKRISRETDVVKREGKKWKSVPIGFLTLTQNETATITNSTGSVVEEHMTDLKRKRRRKKIAVLILSVFALFAAFLFTQMLMQKYSDYRPVPEV